MFIGIYSRSQVSVHRTIGPLVLILLQNIDCWYSLEQPHNLCFSKTKNNVKNKKKKILLKIFNFYSIRKICILHGRVFIMDEGIGCVP